MNKCVKVFHTMHVSALLELDTVDKGRHSGEPSSSRYGEHTMDLNYMYKFKVERPVYQQSTILEAFNDNSTDTFHSDFTPSCSTCRPKKMLLSMFPSILWLGNYQWKEDLIKDIIAGCTVAVMNIPQGMAYALLGNVPPVVGIYMAIYPVLIYALLGTSKHVSMGSFAVICLMTGKVVTMYSVPSDGSIPSVNTTLTPEDVITYTPVQVATAVTFMVAVYQLGMYIFQLGIICSLLSDTLVNGFTAGAAVHVFTSQIKDLLGMKVPKFSGNFQLIYTYIGIFDHLDTINIAAAVVSLTTVSLLLINNEILKPWVSKRSVIPVPAELIVVIIGTVLSTYYGLAANYHLSTVGTIEKGLPGIELPTFSLMHLIAVDSFIIAVIAYIITVSMALIFAQKLNYEIDPNQELLAQGAGNLVGSFFSCMPFAASLSRSAIQQTVGGRTQLAGVVSAGILIVVLISISPVFHLLPRCILASLIIVALKGVLFQVKDLIGIWKLSKMDGIIYISTYLTVVLVEIDVGLAVGVTVSVIIIFIRSMRPYICRLARLPNTDIYVDPSRYSKVDDLNGICIIHYAGGLNFANRGCFKEKVYKLTQRCPKDEAAKIEMASKSNKVAPIDNENELIVIILDLTALQYADPAGASAIHSLAQEYSHIGISVYLAGTSGPVYDVFQKCGLFRNHLFACFPTVHDAVVFAQSKYIDPVHSIRL